MDFSGRWHPIIWHPLARCRSGVQDFGFSWRRLLLFLYTALVGSTVDTSLRQSMVLFCFSAMLGSTVDTNLRQSWFLVSECLEWIQVCVSLWCSFAFQRNAWIDSGYKFASVYGALRIPRNAWFDSGYKFALVYGALSFFSAMLGLTVDTYCRARRRFRSGMALAGMQVAMLSRCVHFVVGRPVEFSQVQSLRQLQLLALPPGIRGRLFGALCIGTGSGGHVHRDMTTIIRCIL